MHIKTLIEEIRGLSLDDRFLVIEQTLQSIKKEELKYSTEVESEETDKNHSDKNFKNIFINEKSLAVDWLSEEDSRWDNLL